MSRDADFLLSPLLKLSFRCRRVRQHVESVKCQDGQFQDAIAAGNVELALSRFGQTNCVQAAAQDFFDGDDRNKLLGQRNRRCTLDRRLMSQQNRSQDVGVERDHSATSASLSRNASSQMSANVGSSRNRPARFVTPPLVSSIGNNSPAFTRRRISTSKATTASARDGRMNVICGMPGTDAE